MPLVELPCVFALLFLWCWTCVEVSVRAGRGPYWGALGLFCNPLVVLLFALPGADAELELPPWSTRLRAACWLSLLQLGLLAAVAGWALHRA
ncbi:MAG: hypothetical protein H6725_08500 [Sandaracinaceae bacterium]|nr:hypothetical protein [Sandaracinaceae bacterium]